MSMIEGFEERFEMFLDILRGALKSRGDGNDYLRKFPYEIEVTKGRRYWKVIISNVINGERVHRSVHAFVDTTTGNVLKPAGWGTPAKHARGNVFSDENGGEAIGPDGFINYMR